MALVRDHDMPSSVLFGFKDLVSFGAGQDKAFFAQDVGTAAEAVDNLIAVLHVRSTDHDGVNRCRF